MEITGNTIIFKSSPRCFLKERYGIKPNTVRIIPEQEKENFDKKFHTLEYIEIVNADTDKRIRRELTDISYHDFGNGAIVYIFSWEKYKINDSATGP